MAYSLALAGEYQLSPRLAIGATASLDNAYQYREWLAALYLRYNFTPQSTTRLLSPRPLASPYLTDRN
ncbi:hypothetical protein WK99_22245 [Burkholderia ubonensis]|nr:hypothetical protein WK99_22245 [Burkholderia ubonensis]